MIALFALIGLLVVCGLWMGVEKLAGSENSFAGGVGYGAAARRERGYSRTEGHRTASHGKGL